MNRNHHYINYAKGHYIRSYSTLNDLEKIAQIDGLSGVDIIIKDLCLVTLTAIKKASDPLTPLIEFTELMFFFQENMPELAKKYGPTPLDSDDDFQKKLKNLYLESILQSLLVIIMRWKVEDELEEPSDKVLPLTDPNKKKKKESNVSHNRIE